MDLSNLKGEVTELHAELCSALADPKRILILYALADKPYNVSELAEAVGISQPAASRHLKILRERGLARPERQGASVEYHLADARLIQALDLLRAVLHDRLHHGASLISVEG